MQAELTELAKKEGLPVINVQPAMYMENFLGQFGVSQGTSWSQRQLQFLIVSCFPPGSASKGGRLAR